MEQFTSRDTMLFLPMVVDMSINVHSYAQITYSSEVTNYFIADRNERYTGTILGTKVKFNDKNSNNNIFS